MLRPVERALVVEDDVALRAAICRILADSSNVELAEAGTAEEARLQLMHSPPPDLLVIDVRLPDESAFSVLDVASRLTPIPIIVATSGKASPDEAFRLGQRGVRKFLRKPFSVEEFLATLDAARRAAPEIQPVISAWVGRVPMRELQQEVRRVMVSEALARTEGSRSGAARLLQVTRQAVQQIVRAANQPPSAPPKGPAS